MKSRYTFGTVVFVPRTILFNGLTFKQVEDITISIDADNKLKALERYIIDRIRRKKYEEKANELELLSYRSLIESIEWTGVYYSLFFIRLYLFAAKFPDLRVKHVIQHINMIRQLENWFFD